MKYIWLITLLFIASASAEVYRWTDEHGNIIYSDQSHPDAEVIDVPEPPSYTPPTIPAFDGPQEKEEAQGYQLVITAPQSDEALWNNSGEVTVSIDLQPALNLDAGQTLLVKVDGQPMGEPQTSTSFTVPIIERGPHTVTVSLTAKAGNVLASKSVNFQIHRASVQ